MIRVPPLAGTSGPAVETPVRATDAVTHARPRARRDTRYEGLRRRQPSAMWPSSATADAARHSWSPPCCSPPAPSTGIGRVDDGTTVTDFDEEEIARKHTLSSSLAYAEWQKDQNQHHRHPGLRQLPDRRARGAPRRRSGGGRRRCRRRRRSADREALGRGRRARPAAHRRRQPARSRARQPRARARVAAPRLRPRDRPDPASARRGEGVHRRRRPGANEGADVRRRRQDDRGRDPELRSPTPRSTRASS